MLFEMRNSSRHHTCGILKPGIYLFLLSLSLFSCQSSSRQQSPTEIDITRQQAIVDKYLGDSARQYSYYSKEWQKYIDMGLKEDSTIAYLWQQKAMPLFKQGKYELGMQYLDKAVFYDKDSYLDYRGFIKCVLPRPIKRQLLTLKKPYAETEIVT